jgi:hypothetical protein
MARIDLDFAPDAFRARLLDARMQRELGASLAHVCEASAGVIPFDAAAMDRLVNRLAAGRPARPATFARYYDLVGAIDDDRFDAAEALFAELAAAEPAPEAMEIVALGDDSLGVENARYLRMMNADSSLDLGFLPPTAEAAAAFRERLSAGFDLLETTLPELCGEVRAIVRQLVIAGSDPSKKYQFDGGSHYQLWGALFLNANYHPDAVAVAEVLAHESAHSLLFGFCTEETLVENDDDELYASPLRVDPRPMDGIYHATFVSARMHWAMSALARSGALDEAGVARAQAAAAADLLNFDKGHGVVAEHGRLSPLGRALMDGAKGYMDSVR